MTTTGRLRFGFICGVFVLALLALSPTAARAATFSYSVSCPTADTVVGPIKVLATTIPGTVNLTPNVPVTVGLLPHANIIVITTATPVPGTSTGTLSCTLTLGGVTVSFTRSFTFVVPATGPGTMTVGAVSVVVNLGPQGVVSLSAPDFQFTVDFTLVNVPIVIPLFSNTTVLLTPPGIPTLSTWAWMIMLAVLLGSALVFLRRGIAKRA